MAKLTEKQINIIAVSAGVLVLIIFAVMSYFDYEDMDRLAAQQKGVQDQIDKAKAKKAQLVGLKSDLYVFKGNYDFVKEKLPDEKEILKFYETLDDFRLKKNLQPWKRFEVMEQGFFTRDDADAKDPKAAKKPTGPKAPQPLVSTEYQATLPLTFNQLGEMLIEIENYPRYYGVTSLNIPAMTAITKESTEPMADVNLTLVCFTYSQKSLFKEGDVEKLLKDFKPGEKENKKLQEIKNKWQIMPFQWTPLTRNPFDKTRVLTPTAAKDPTKTGTIVEPPKKVEEIDKMVAELEQHRNQHLHPFAVAGLWIELQNKLVELKYEANLATLPANLKPAAKQKVDQLQAELRTWKIEIEKLGMDIKAHQFLGVAAKKIQTMETLYTQGKEEASIATFQQLLAIYNELLIPIKKYEPLENKIPQLQTTRKQAEELYRKADTQIKIITEVQKIDLQGIIFWANKPQFSVAFMNKKVVRKDDSVENFVVHDIRETEVILRFKDETVPVRLKRVAKGATMNKKPS